MSYLGLDIGNGGCKAVIFDVDGKSLASAFREYSTLRLQKNWAELDSQEVMDKCFEVIREVNHKVQDPVVAMSVSSQGEAFTPVGKGGKILGNAMVSSDSRASDMVPYMNSLISRDDLYKITGHTPHPIFTLYKLLWLKANQPSIWKNTSQFLCFEDLFHFKLGIEPHISWPLAGRTMLFNVLKHEWSSEILSIIGLDSSRLAKPVPSGEVVGYIPEKLAAGLGFEGKVMVVSGGHDQTCAALGAGVVEPGLCMYATGSVECFCPMLEKPSFTDELKNNNLCCYDYTIKGNYTTVAYSLTGGNILRWLRDEFGFEEREIARKKGGNAYQYLLEKMPANPTDLLVLPYFSASGTPYFDSNAKGAIIGLQQYTKKEDIIKAMLEGVALEMKLNLQLMEEAGMIVNAFVATGGGTRNALWTQLKADILNKKVIVRDIDEAGCYGVALLAMSAEKGIPVEKLIKKFDLGGTTFIPHEGRAQLYEEKFLEYKKLYPVLRQFWEK